MTLYPRNRVTPLKFPIGSTYDYSFVTANELVWLMSSDHRSLLVIKCKPKSRDNPSIRMIHRFICESYFKMTSIISD